MILLTFGQCSINHLSVSNPLTNDIRRCLLFVLDYNFHVDTILNFRGHLDQHVFLWVDVNQLEWLHQVKKDLIVKTKLAAMSSIDKSVLNEVLVEVELVITHGMFLVLDNWNCLQLKSEWHMREPKIFG